MYSLIIKNANVIDGSGNEGRVLDVAVQGDEIVAIDKNIKASAESVIDAGGRVLTPGFIDIQNHSDSYWQLFDNPGLDSMVSQGFTTIVVGNCGASLAPLLSHEALFSMQKWHSLQATNVNWSSFTELLEVLSKLRLGCNVASLVGYSTLRRAVVGDEVRGLRQDELNSLTSALRNAMESGAYGLSNGLSYAHEIIVSELELFELAKIVKNYSGLFSVHLRSEGGEIIEAIEEALDIARHTGVNLKISHLKVKNEQNWPKAPEILSLLETAYHQNINVGFDVYPYTTTWQALYSYLPKWAIEGGRTILLKHLADPVQKNKILLYLNNLGVKFSTVKIASTANKLSFAGKNLGQVAKNLETSSEQAVLHLIENGGSEVLVFEENLNPDIVNQFLLHPLSLIGTDGAGFAAAHGPGLVHPRCFGTAAKFLKLSTKQNALSLSQAIYKLTLGPAKKLGLKRRGQIAVGNFADLVLFDPENLSDMANYENPYVFSQGITQVFVNGRLAWQNGKATNNYTGYVLRRS